MLNNDVQGSVTGIYISRDNNFVLSGNIFGNNLYGIHFVEVSNRTVSNSNLVFPTTVTNPIQLTSVTGFTLDNINVAGNPASPSGTGIYLLNSSNNTITNSDASNKFYGIRLSSASNGNVVSNNLIRNATVGGYAILVDLAMGAAGGNQLLNNDVQGSVTGIYISRDNNFVLSGNIFGNNLNGIHFVEVSNRTISNLAFPTSVTNPIRLTSATSFTLDNVTVAGDPTARAGVGFLLASSSNNTITNSDVSNKLTGIQMSGASNNNVATHNNIFGNGRNISSALAIELSLNGQGNYWGRSCPGPLFVPGTDSNLPNVVDSFPYGAFDGWLGGGPGCNGAPVTDAGGPYNVNEGGSVTVTATGSDPENGRLTYAWDLDNDGTFEASGQSATFSAARLDGPSSYTIKVQVTDNGGRTATDQATVNVLNVAPTATFTSTPSIIIVGKSVTLTFSNQFDPSAADVAAGFLYSYDCNGDGTFEVSDVAAASHVCAYPVSGTFTAKGRIKDKDGGSTVYTVQVKVRTPQEAVQNLIDQVLALNKPQGNGLIGKLNVVIKRLDKNEITQAIAMLQQFIDQVNVFMSNGTFTVAEGQPLIDAANAIIAALSNPAPVAGFKKDVSDGLTAITSALPTGFQLEQNSPNPFNPTTTIQFSVPRESYVRLKVYNSFGAEVVTLINRQVAAGIYKINWDASRLASGFYLYRLEAEGFAQTKKLLLMK